MLNPENVAQRIEEIGVVPVVAINDARHSEKLAEALVKGGIPCAEVTFRTAAAEESIRRMVSAHPDMLVGAGTVLSVAQAETAVAAGAQFIVAPGFDPELVDWCIENNVAVFPGVLTPSELTQAYKRGLKVVKFFPAGQFGGLAAIKALSAPFVGMRFMPTGGVSLSNLTEYLGSDKVAACGGTWLAKTAMIDAEEFSKIEENAREAMRVVAELRG